MDGLIMTFGEPLTPCGDCLDGLCTMNCSTPKRPGSMFPQISEAELLEGLRPLLPPEETTMDEPMMQFFAYEHLPEHLQKISKPFGELAQHLVDTLPRNPERTAGLRKLLEAKDCAVRAQIFKG
jgi:hypothetical protein